MGFADLILRRVAASVFTLLLVSLTIFVSVQGLPGDAAARVLGREASEAAKARLRTELQLDQPLAERYVKWLGGTLEGDLGTSLANGKPVAALIAPRLRNTLALTGVAFLIYVPLSILAAVLQACMRDTWIDRTLSTITGIVLCTPEFLFATLLLFAFAVWIPAFPPIARITADLTWGGFFHTLLLPASSLAIIVASYGTRLLRESLIGILESDYVRFARLRGLSGTRILVFHVLPRALIPWMNATALNIAFMIGGVVVVERVFGFPGFGSMLVDSLQLRDLPVVSAGVLLAAGLFIVVNLIADLGAMVVDPRLRVQA